MKERWKKDKKVNQQPTPKNLGEDEQCTFEFNSSIIYLETWSWETAHDTRNKERTANWWWLHAYRHLYIYHIRSMKTWLQFYMPSQRFYYRSLHLLMRGGYGVQQRMITIIWWLGWIIPLINRLFLSPLNCSLLNEDDMDFSRRNLLKPVHFFFPFPEKHVSLHLQFSMMVITVKHVKIW